ncbi:tRNA (adenosine(37)-N6)-threonylcarbamoyltransferase complex ATPase subunit type 1 TsaE [Rubellicoccus peritrichatus]|uniref:tRNA threonylcarbamoyladenosine biosynthesis protein TsaE n=1 Tax=Rubellicoccus peritrichatus TaxID=3080537 RepID=A0AAQ3QXD2_9BACT|nr:tRNA (adenosine(37)-N6)-threonylcarbamoyltransferase complex ATPase subunit type 1 TsaE [Puniceicoccus sp. CR14]WOO43563.1 tRNA (adenosine(37)-N6)-threonylcarbamoyltransferase complex ATPase subunit type 1 TsaE [Puniceicoccus sp. CR14]
MDVIAELQAGCLTTSAEETIRLAERLAEVLPVDTALVLEGDLGAGKTTFVQGLARAWRITDPVTSPTYAIYSLYRGERMLIHIDAYRIENPEEGDSLLIEDLLESPWNLAVEWPEKIDAWWLQGAWKLSLKRIAPGQHQLSLSLV